MCFITRCKYSTKRPSRIKGKIIFQVKVGSPLQTSVRWVFSLHSPGVRRHCTINHIRNIAPKYRSRVVLLFIYFSLNLLSVHLVTFNFPTQMTSHNCELKVNAWWKHKTALSTILTRQMCAWYISAMSFATAKFTSFFWQYSFVWVTCSMNGFQIHFKIAPYNTQRGSSFWQEPYFILFFCP